ncbi:MAG: class I SAM-dependent DNA methyltransferase [Lachnospirales bacterium]
MKDGIKMDIYNNFAKVYDTFMSDVPYDKWALFLDEVWKKYELNPKNICDLGCGTGTLTSILAKKYNLIGVDLSPEMLMIARDKSSEKNLDILYIEQDMTEFHLGFNVDSIYCLCDSLNYLLEEAEVLDTFIQCNKHLAKNGLLIFDLNTEYKFKNMYGSNVFADNSEYGSYIWKNEYLEDEQINIYDVCFFIQKGQNNYEKFDEYHEERAYSLSKIKELLEKANLEFLEAVNIDFTEVSKTSERMYIIARERGK